uniref:Uncharacterized protein n=1 Tax=Anguilla anguilla TaxID=7936 RepID=A0A0E9WN31_ANGAN
MDETKICCYKSKARFVFYPYFILCHFKLRLKSHILLQINLNALFSHYLEYCGMTQII